MCCGVSDVCEVLICAELQAMQAVRAVIGRLHTSALVTGEFAQTSCQRQVAALLPCICPSVSVCHAANCSTPQGVESIQEVDSYMDIQPQVVYAQLDPQLDPRKGMHSLHPP